MKPSHDRALPRRPERHGYALRLCLFLLSGDATGAASGKRNYGMCATRCANAGAPSWPAQREVTAFCLGSLRDAWCLRRECRPAHQPEPRISGAAGQCLLRLCTLLAVCVVLASLLPGVEAERDPARFQVNPGVILIQTSASTDRFAPTISPALFRDWKGTRQRYFDEFAFYRTVRETASLSSRRASMERDARQSAICFRCWDCSFRSIRPQATMTRGLPPQSSATMPGAAISPMIPTIAGRVIRIGNRTARIAGVMPYRHVAPARRARCLAARAGFAADRSVSREPSGYLVAHLSPRGQDAMAASRVSISGPRRRG